jgi:hypothetical protein
MQAGWGQEKGENPTGLPPRTLASIVCRRMKKEGLFTDDDFLAYVDGVVV